MSDILTKPKVKIDEQIKKQAKEQEALEKQIIVHCTLNTPATMDIGIRIWPTTYLLDNHSDHKSILVHQENIPMMPDWKSIPAGKKYTFTLFFSGLPKSCTTFHMVELIPQSGGFEVMNISRNKLDVYSVKL